MSSMTVALIAFACIFCGALLGLRISSFLPDHHLNESTRDVVKLGAGLIATLAALVLGQLVSSPKDDLDTINTELTQQSARIILLMLNQSRLHMPGSLKPDRTKYHSEGDISSLVV